MIPVLRRTQAPDSIKPRSTLKTEYDNALQIWIANGKHGDKPTPKYNQKDVKIALMEDFHKKCAYCESKFERIVLDIEHYKPKSIYPELALDWDNFLLACKACNTKKLNSFDETKPPVNPCSDSPDQFFNYKLVEDENSGKKLLFIVPKQGRTEDENRALETIDCCALNRDMLIELRARAISDAKSQKYMHENQVDNEYLLRYSKYQDEEQYLGVLKFFQILPE
jgi:uncharacterized protein (TIGR02646 family)